MYKLQFVNALTQDLLREEVYKDSKMIFKVLKTVEDSRKNGMQSFMFDSQRRTQDIEYVSHTVLTDDRHTIYRLYFKVKLAKVQARIR